MRSSRLRYATLEDDKQGLDSSTTLHYARNDSIDEILTTPLRSAQDDNMDDNLMVGITVPKDFPYLLYIILDFI